MIDMYKYIRIKMIEKDIKEIELAKRCNELQGNFNRKIKSDMKVSFLNKVADALDCDLIIEFRERNDKE